MANYRPIYSKIWKDPDFEEYSLDGKLLFIYLCTNTSVTESGIYPISPKTISNETGIPFETVTELLSNHVFKNILYDFDTKHVFIINFRKYASMGGKPTLIKKSIQNDFIKSKSTFLWSLFIKEYPEFKDSILTVGKPLANSTPINLNLISNLNLNLKERKEEENCSQNEVSKTIFSKTEKCPHQKIIELWKKILPDLKITDNGEWNSLHQGLLREIWNEKEEYQSLEFWQGLFEKIRDNSPFLLGKIKPKFKATLGWIVLQDNFKKVMDSKYFENGSIKPTKKKKPEPGAHEGSTKPGYL